jgi:hypothetical protein
MKQLKRNGGYGWSNYHLYTQVWFHSFLFLFLKEYKRKLEIRESERNDREFELLNEFDKVIERIKSARIDATKTGSSSGVNYTSITEAYRNFKFECEKCHNKVRNHLSDNLSFILN